MLYVTNRQRVYTEVYLSFIRLRTQPRNTAQIYTDLSQRTKFGFPSTQKYLSG